MLDKKIRILNFDNSVVKQKRLLSGYENDVIDLTDIGPDARNFMNSRTRARIAGRLEGSSRSSVTFLGSGDFHHVSEILLDRFDEPISVIVFDHHPDWDILPPRLGCGSWVNEVLRKPNIVKLVLVGVSSKDISTFNIETGNLGSLRNNRVEIYPYEHPPTTVFLRRIPQNDSVENKRRPLFSEIRWNELSGKDIAGFFKGLLGRISSKKVYVSIDKDCLKEDHAVTNWERGRLTLEELLLMLRLIRENMDVAGLDVAGDYSDISVKGIFKKITSYLDHPREVRARDMGSSKITAINEETNLKILDMMI